MTDEYPYGKEIQLNFLSLHVRKPKLIRDIIQPSYFNSPIHVDIARVVSENRKKHPEDRLKEHTLWALVKRDLGRRRRDDWPAYKEVIRAIFRHHVHDRATVVELAEGFARDQEYRKFFVQSEKQVNSGDFDGVDRAYSQLREKFQPKQGGPAGTPSPKLPVYLLHEFLAREENDSEADNHLVLPIVPKNGAVLVYGLPKELKSWFGLELAVDVASGRKALGYFAVARAAKTLYVQVEDAEFLTRERLQLVTRNAGLRKLAGLGMLRIIPRCALNLADAAWVSALEQEIQKSKPELIVLDVFRRLFRGNVADSEETAKFLQVLDRLRDTYHCAIVLTHHAKKAESAAMQAMALGSVNLTAWADVLVYTSGKRQIGSTSVAGLQIETKSSLPEESELEIIVDSESEPVVCVQAKGGNKVEQLRKLIAKTPGILQTLLQEKSGIPIKLLRKTLKDGAERGFWKEDRGKGEGNRLTYYLPERTKK